jgi:hypothetical protein
MALPSQTARPASRRSYMYHRRRTRRGPLVLAVLALVVIVAVVWILSLGLPGPVGPALTNPTAMNDPLESGEPQEQASRAGPAGPVAPTETNSATPPVETPAQPRTVEMGASAVAGNTPTENRSTPPRQEPPPTAQPPLASREPEALLPAAPRRPDPGPDARRRAMERMLAGTQFLESNRPLEARRMLTAALDAEALEPDDEQLLRNKLTELNSRLVFSPEVVEGDPFSRTYTVQGGDALSLLPRQQGLSIDWRLLQRVNGISDARRIREGQRIKLVTGPFHAVIHKRSFRMDVYLGEGNERVYVRSFPVGLGEYNSTPNGVFRVRANSKLMDPEWVNPRTGQRYNRSDPDNPIGERWIGLEGVSETVRNLTGYGIHGTIEPESIGRQSSLGCIRMRADDVELLYEMLVTVTSTVEIRED